jgi:hypothetical protein
VLKLRLVVGILFFVPAFAFGDSIELKDGTKIEGRIISVDSSQVRIEMEIASGIREEESHPRSEVAQIQRATPDGSAFKEINSVPVPATSDESAVYDAPLERVRSFMRSYTYSKHMPEAHKLAPTLESACPPCGQCPQPGRNGQPCHRPRGDGTHCGVTKRSPIATFPS